MSKILLNFSTSFIKEFFPDGAVEQDWRARFSSRPPQLESTLPEWRRTSSSSEGFQPAGGPVWSWSCWHHGPLPAGVGGGGGGGSRWEAVVLYGEHEDGDLLPS